MSDVPCDWITVPEIARWMAVSESTVHRWIADKRLPAFSLGQTVRVREKALAEFVLEWSTL